MQQCIASTKDSLPSTKDSLKSTKDSLQQVKGILTDKMIATIIIYEIHDYLPFNHELQCVQHHILRSINHTYLSVHDLYNHYFHNSLAT